MKRKSNLYSIGDAINAFLKKHNLEDEAQIQRIIAEWPKLMGTPIANQTDKIWFHKGTLYVRITSPVWKQELSYGKSKIRKLLNRHIKQELIKEVKIV